MSQPLSLQPAVKPNPAPDARKRRVDWGLWRRFCQRARSPRELQQQSALGCACGPRAHAGRCPPAGGPEAGEVSRLARPGPASPFPAGPASHPVSFRLRQRRGMWRGRLGSSDAWVRSAPSSRAQGAGARCGSSRRRNLGEGKQVSSDWGPWRGLHGEGAGGHSSPRTPHRYPGTQDRTLRPSW